MRFFRNCHLKRHTLSHTGERNFRCEVPDCGQTYLTKQHLQRHTRLHSDERPYVCHYPDCKERFAKSHKLREHERTHEGLLPMLCSVSSCGARFLTQSELRKHNRLAHRKKQMSVWTNETPKTGVRGGGSMIWGILRSRDHLWIRLLTSLHVCVCTSVHLPPTTLLARDNSFLLSQSLVDMCAPLKTVGWPSSVFWICGVT